jgi:hypothetical protein
LSCLGKWESILAGNSNIEALLNCADKRHR